MIIGLCGYKGAGKTTVAEYLEKKYKFKRVNFKDSLIEEMKKNFPLTLENLVGIYSNEVSNVDDLFQIKPLAMRALMQEYGTEVRRGDDESYWARQWTKKVQELGGNIVVDDVRFFNELSAITELDAVLVRVKRTDVTTGGLHQSELEQEKFIEDFTIEAGPGNITIIHKQIDDIINTIKSNTD